MVLCAGYGTRLGNLTDATPKAMLLIEGKPILEYILSNLSFYGFREIVINLHFMPELIRSYFRDGSDWGIELQYSYEPVLLGTAGAIKKMESFLAQDETFLLHYGDIITDQNFSEMMSFHDKKKAIGTLLLHKRLKSNSIVEMDETGKIALFLERPQSDNHPARQRSWVNSGVSIFDREIFRCIPSESFCDLPRDIFPGIIETGRLFGYPLSSYRCAVDSPERYKEAQRAISAGECRIPDVRTKESTLEY